MRSLVTMLAAALLDSCRPRAALVAENALLRHQILVLQRAVARPRLRPIDRLVAVALAAITPAWRDVLRIVQPATLLRWHRAGFRALWRWRSRAPPARVAKDTLALIRSMAEHNTLWGAERIRGGLLKLGILVSKRTVQKHMARPARRGPGGSRWSAFLKAHAGETWACDFLQTYDIFFRPLFAFAIIELGSRRVVHAAATGEPTSGWVTQQLRNATAWGVVPRFLLRDRDGKFGSGFDALAKASGIRVVQTAVRAPNMNAFCERWLGSLRRECLDHVIVLGERHLHRVLAEYVRYHNAARPHQGIGQRTPVDGPRPRKGPIIAVPVLGGLHHDYRRAA
jgi:transposase InsO family protein